MASAQTSPGTGQFLQENGVAGCGAFLAADLRGATRTVREERDIKHSSSNNSIHNVGVGFAESSTAGGCDVSSCAVGPTGTLGDQYALDASDEWLLRSWRLGPPGTQRNDASRLRTDAMFSFASFAEFPSGAEHSSRRPRRRGDQV